VSFNTYSEAEVEDPLADLLGQDETENVDEEELENNTDEIISDEFDDSVTSPYVECFKIVGSNWEQRYQDALNKCYELLVKKEKIEVRAKEEPENICDKNAIKFEVFHSGQWHIMGYCGVKKIPKLKRTIHIQSVINLEIFNLRRRWIPQIREYRFTAGVNIVKVGRWERDDLNNKYNSLIPL
jgi:hypothetical protein